MTKKCVLSASPNNRGQGFNLHSCMPRAAPDYCEMLRKLTDISLLDSLLSLCVPLITIIILVLQTPQI